MFSKYVQPVLSSFPSYQPKLKKLANLKRDKNA